MNKARTTHREFAVGMDRPPIGHVALMAGAWQGKVRRNGRCSGRESRSIISTTPSCPSSDDLRSSPEIAAEALRLAA